MKARVQKWGNSLAIRIPKVFATQTGLVAETVVDLELIEGELVIRPPTRTPPTLDELLRGVRADNLHGEWDTGPAVGNEAW